MNNKIVFGWTTAARSGYLQLVIDPENKSIKRGYYLAQYTEIKLTSRKQLDSIQAAYISAGYTVIID